MICFRRLLIVKTTSPVEEDVFDEDISLPKLEVSDPGKILQLLENLTDRTTKQLEGKINRYVSTIIRIYLVFQT